MQGQTHSEVISTGQSPYAGAGTVNVKLIVACDAEFKRLF